MFTPILEGKPYAHSVGKLVCVGRNYAEHAREMKAELPTEPVLFIKPADAACGIGERIFIPKDRGAVHHELEIAVLIGERLVNASEAEAAQAIAGVGLGLDLTLRDLQDQLKAKSLPWERSKAFDGASPLTAFVAVERVSDWQQLSFSLMRNGQLQQKGDSAAMIFPVLSLLATISQNFTLNPGDVVLTGTPAGAGPVVAGDSLSLKLENWISVTTQVV